MYALTTKYDVLVTYQLIYAIREIICCAFFPTLENALYGTFMTMDYRQSRFDVLLSHNYSPDVWYHTNTVSTQLSNLKNNFLRVIIPDLYNHTGLVHDLA